MRKYAKMAIHMHIHLRTSNQLTRGSCGKPSLCVRWIMQFLVLCKVLFIVTTLLSPTDPGVPWVAQHDRHFPSPQGGSCTDSKMKVVPGIGSTVNPDPLRDQHLPIPPVRLPAGCVCEVEELDVASAVGGEGCGFALALGAPPPGLTATPNSEARSPSVLPPALSLACCSVRWGKPHSCSVFWQVPSAKR